MVRVGGVDGQALLIRRSRLCDQDEPPVGRNRGRDLPDMSIVPCQLLRLAAAIGADPHDAIVAAGH